MPTFRGNVLPPFSELKCKLRLQKSVLKYRRTARIGALIDPKGVGITAKTSVDSEEPFCKTTEIMAKIKQWEVQGGHERWSKETVVPKGMLQLQREWDPYHSNISVPLFQAHLLLLYPAEVDSWQTYTRLDGDLKSSHAVFLFAAVSSSALGRSVPSSYCNVAYRPVECMNVCIRGGPSRPLHRDL
jgi:hypothetical protein